MTTLKQIIEEETKKCLRNACAILVMPKLRVENTTGDPITEHNSKITISVRDSSGESHVIHAGEMLVKNVTVEADGTVSCTSEPVAKITEVDVVNDSGIVSDDVSSQTADFSMNWNISKLESKK